MFLVTQCLFLQIDTISKEQAVSLLTQCVKDDLKIGNVTKNLYQFDG
jgi:hypothetical protein